MIADLLRVLLVSALAASAAILCVLLARKTMRMRFGANAAYALWLSVPLTAAVALLPAPVVSIALPILPMAAAPMAVAPVPVAPSTNQFDVVSWLAAMWLLGLGVCATLLMRQQSRFVRALGRLSAVSERTLRAEATAGCPALVGALRPRIVLPADFEQRYSKVERELILAHERAHCARGDAQINVLAAVLRCLFWFNPLVHIAASRFRFDQELACDAAVIARFPEARRPYSDAMLKTQLADIGLPVGCYWQASHPLKERIAMLKEPLPGRARVALGAMIAITLVCGATYAAWAAQPAAPVVVKSAMPDAIRADITFTLDSNTPRTITIVNPPGQPFTVRDGEGENALELQGTMNPRSDGTFELNTSITFMRGGRIVGSPSIIVRAGEPGEIRVGNEADGKFEGFRLQVTLRDAPPSENTDYRMVFPPKYPDEAVRAKQSGKLLFKVLVDEYGVPRSVAVSKAEPPEGADIFTKPSTDAIMQWHFNPGMKDGKPQAGYVSVPIDFVTDL